MYGRPSVAIIGWPQETSAELTAAWRELGVPAEMLTPPESLALLDRGDVALARLDVLETLDGVQSGLDALDELERRGVRVLNSARALLNAHDKLLTAECLERAGVPQPRTAHLVATAAEVPLPPPLVLKPRFGSWGADVFRCETTAELARVLDEVRTRPWFKSHGALLQALVPPVGHDLRVLVAAGTVVGAAERVARPGEWRTNVSLGAQRRKAHLTRGLVDLAIRAARAIGADFVGVDLLPADDGYVVLELNGAVEFDETYSLPGGNVYQTAADAHALPRVEELTAVAR